MSPRFLNFVDSSLPREPETEKAALEPLLSPPAPIEDQPRPHCLGLRRRRRCLRNSTSETRTRGHKICVKFLHFLAFAALFIVFLGPTLHRGIRALWMAQYPHREECVERAIWAPYNEPPHEPHFRFASSTSFELPRFSDLLYFMSSGSYANGAISIANRARVPTGVVEVEVVASYNSRELFDSVEVCTVHRDGDENKNGVGIFTPHYWPRPNDRRIHFFINVKLPLPDGGPEGQYLFFNDLETRLPLFAHHIGDLQETALFHLLDLASTNTPIDVESLLAEQVSIKTTNSNIRGSFNVTDKLELSTTNGAIRVDASLDSNGTSEASATLHSTNGPVISNFNLLSSASDGTKGVFRVTTSSSNSPIEANFPTAPINHTLYLNAHTSNSPVTVKLHNTFEGTFSLSSSPFIPPTIQYDRDAPDPEERSRRRRIEYSRQRRGELVGHATWSPERRDLGVVAVSTSNSPAHLVL